VNRGWVHVAVMQSCCGPEGDPAKAPGYVHMARLQRAILTSTASISFATLASGLSHASIARP
jgi:hypothetical protein